MITNKKDVNHIKFEDKDFYYLLIKESNGKIISGYLDKLVEGRIVLYKRYKCSLLKNSNDYVISSGDVVDKFDQDEEYYISKNNEPAYEIKIRKRKLLNIFGKNIKQMKKYLKNNKYRKEQDLIKLFKYYNSL
ncbi:MAG: hypothetical protein U9R54_01055 [Bacteroidota bacterium]|nr:hypothetical protein [Bacteroidota bacterium]